MYWYQAGVLPKEGFGGDYLLSLRLLNTVFWPGMLSVSFPSFIANSQAVQYFRISHCHLCLPPGTTEAGLTSVALLLKAFLFSLPPAAVPWMSFLSLSPNFPSAFCPCCPPKPGLAESLKPLQLLPRAFYLFPELWEVTHRYFGCIWELHPYIDGLCLSPSGCSQHPVSFCGRIRLQSTPWQGGLVPERSWSRVGASH